MGTYIYIAYKSKPINTPFCTIHRFKYLCRAEQIYEPFARKIAYKIEAAWGTDTPTFGVIEEIGTFTFVLPLSKIYWHDCDTLPPPAGCIIKENKKYKFYTLKELIQIFQEETGHPPVTAAKQSEIYLKSFEHETLIKAYLQKYKYKGILLPFIESL